jgi:8-oxo-dGTP diphosphatase
MNKFFIAGHALIRKGEKYLVLKRSEKNDYMPLKWDIPGGIVEMGETVEQAVIREVKEETGLEIVVNKVIYIYSNINQVPQRQDFQVVYDCLYTDGEVSINHREHETYRWTKYSEIENLDTIDFLKELLKNYSPEKEK